jgi:trehalose 6-phosphate synthase/phosphatase
MVSNRLPVSLRITDGNWTSRTSNGGLASAVGGIKTDSAFPWVGWPGCVVPEDLQPEVAERLAQDDLSPMFLTQTEEERYYANYSNQFLWPLFHYFTDKIAHDDRRV